MLCRPLLVFGMSLAIRYFIRISICLLNPISSVLHSSHLSIWLTTSLFSEYVSVLLCGNKFININFSIRPIRDIIGYVSLAFWLTSSCMIICSVIYGASNGIVSILFCVGDCIVYTDLSFVHSSDDGRFCCFHVLAMVNTAAIHDVPSVSFWFWSSQVPGPIVSLPDHMVTQCLPFQRTAILFLLLAVTTSHPT